MFHTYRSYVITWNHLGMLYIICQKICIGELKYIYQFSAMCSFQYLGITINQYQYLSYQSRQLCTAVSVPNTESGWSFSYVQGILIVPLSTIFYWILVCFLVCLFVCLMVLTPLSTIFLLYRGGQFYWWRKPEDREKLLTYRKSLTNFTI